MATNVHTYVRDWECHCFFLFSCGMFGCTFLYKADDLSNVTFV